MGDDIETFPAEPPALPDLLAKPLRQGAQPTFELQVLDGLQARQDAENRVPVAVTPIPLDVGGGISEIDLDLSALSATAAAQLDTEGWALRYRREGSNPAGRLTLQLGGTVTDFTPGMEIRGFFRKASVMLATRSAAVGRAKLQVLTRRDVDFREAQEPTPGERFQPVDLLGSSSAPTFIDMLVNTQPSAAAPAYSFITTGYKRIRVLIDGLQDGTNTLTTVDIIPWVREPNSGLWLEQGTQRIGVPDSAGTAYRYRVITLDVAGAGRMALELRNTVGTPGNPTKLGLIVQAIE